MQIRFMTLFLGHFIPLLMQIAGGSAGAWFFTEAVKRAKFIPINPGQTVRIRAACAVISAVLGVVVAWSNGSLDAGALQASFVTILSAGGMWWGAHTIHSSLPSIPPVNS